ncbi:hypothetical protein DPMN_081165 [Dreissena polymorpha]|uniref:Uncharacterized protein n=1 Tax=Dreissena polymorpha TaxID=45954 RepID=A0A9D3Y5I8_DREPO|nr:hypothetical protein DPMN_081165 [Dreissena polymorpha]
MVCDWSESVPEELRDLLIHLSRTTLALSHTSASSMSEMLRIRRDLILTSLPKDFLLEPGMNSLRTAPLTSGFLFGGRIQEAITADKDDQLHASLARNNSGQRQGVFKHPASRPPAVPAFKTAKRNNIFSKKPSFNPRSGPNRQSSYNRPSLSHKSSNKDSGKKGQTQAGTEEFQTFYRQGRTSCLSALGPFPFYRHNLRCLKYQSGPDFSTSQIDGFKLLQTHGFILL